MAIKGIGKEYDFSFLASSALQTTSSQYKVVGIEASSTSADLTAYLTNAGAATADTGTARYAIGINQTYASSGSNEVSVRMFGISKALCAASIAAGSYVSAYEGISTTTYAGAIVQAVAPVAAITSTSTLTSTERTILGRALEAGSATSIISVMVNPQREIQPTGTVSA